MIRILHVLGKLDRGGAETWLVQSLRHVDRDKYSMDFLVHSPDPGAYDDEVRSFGARIIPCLSPYQPALYAENFFRILREYGPYNVVHSHVHHYSGYVLMLAAMAGVSLRIAHSHNDTRPVRAHSSLGRLAYLKIMQMMIHAFATRGLAVSGEAGDDLFGRNWRNNARWQLQYLGIDLSRFDVPVDRSSLRKELGIASDAFVVGHVGRFVQQKNHAFIVEIAREVVKLQPTTIFLLVGGGTLRKEIEAQVAAYSLQKHFVFAGVRPDVPAIMKGAMDVFLFPSLHEGLPITILEVQAAGLPCLMSNVISRDTDVIDRLLFREALTIPASVWGKRLIEISTTKHGCDSTLKLLSSRSITTSVKLLTSVYSAPSHA
jgi:glycosyltransferase involved in cell wall biosynthesis